MAASTRTPMGIRHVTVVPANFEPEDDEEDEVPETDDGAGDGAA